MGVTVKHVLIDKKTGRLSYRRVYPSDLRPFIPKQPRELKVSLGGRSTNEPEALRRHADAQAAYSRIVKIARLKASGASRTMTEADISTLVQTYAHRLRKSLNDTHFDDSDDRRDWMTASAWRYAPFAFMDEVASLPLGRASVWTNSERIREELPNLIATWNMMVADGDKSAVIQAEGQTAEDLLTEHSLRADVDAPVFFTLCRSLLSTDISSAGQLLRLSTGGVEIDPIDLPIFPTPRQSEVTTSPPLVKGETMNQLGQRLILQGRSEITPTTAQGWRTALRFWEETHGNIGWDAITRRKVDEWLDLLKQRPKRIGRSVDNVPLPELVKLLSHDIKVPRLSGKTVRQHLGALSAIWGKVGAKGWIEREDNPFSKHDVRIDHTPKGKPLTVAELNAVFGLPVFSANARPKRGRGEACYWVPLFALFTGARPGEIAKLIVSDFWQADGGKWMMRYTDEGEHPAIGKRHLKTSIHGTGERMFPVPQPLLDLRLPLYLQWLHKQGAAALFPKLTRTTKGLYDGWGRWWAEYVDEVKTPDKRPLRELRHNFPTAARKSGVAEEAISYILGHTIAGQRTTSRYGERESWGEQIQQVRFDGLEFASIIPWGAPR